MSEKIVQLLPRYAEDGTFTGVTVHTIDGEGNSPLPWTLDKAKLPPKVQAFFAGDQQAALLKLRDDDKAAAMSPEQRAGKAKEEAEAAKAVLDKQIADKQKERDALDAELATKRAELASASSG